MKKMFVLFVAFAVSVSALPALPPLGIELGMSLSELNELFTEPQYYEQFTGNRFMIDPDMLKDKSAHVFDGYYRSEGPVAFFRDGVVIGLYMQSARLFEPVHRNTLDTSNNVLARWNLYISEFSERWGTPAVTFPDFPLVMPDNTVIRNFSALLWGETALGIEAVFPNGIRCRMQRMGQMINIVFTWGEMPWR